MSHYKPYEAYKDSGVEWIGPVPEHWEVKRLRHVATLNPSPDWQALEQQQRDYPFLPMEAIGEAGELDCSGRKPLDGCRSGYTYFAEGDVAYAKVTPCFENGKGAVMRGLVGGHGFGTTELTVLRPTAIDRDYLYALTFADSFRQPGASEMLGSGGLKRVPDEFTRNYRTAIPPCDEQTAITAALARETARIDALIAKKTRFIELLKEKRQALITHAVTKGLDPSVKMKDSRVAWLGEVPEHWAVSRLGHFATVENGTTPSRANEAYWVGGDVAWLGSGEVNQVVVTEATEYITELALRECSLRLLPKGTVVVGMVGQGKTRGLSAILGIDATINQNMAAVCSGPKLNGLFLLNVFTAAYEWLREGGRGSNQAALNCELLGEFRLAVPPDSEQQEIVACIADMTKRLDSITSKTERSMSLLKERRSALITAAVTGQIDLRESA